MEKTAKYERPSSLLIVEDDQSQLRTLTSIMEEEGFDVIGCSAVSEALEHLNRLETGVVVLDLHLPDLSGTQLLERLATATDRIRVVINTAYSSYESAKDALNLGAFAYVEKASDPEELIRHVHRAFEASLRSYADQLEAAVAERTRKLHQANELLRQEIADRKRAEEALRAALAWQEAVFEGSRDAVLISDADSKFVMVNRAACELTGYSKNELLVMRIPDLHEKEDLTAYKMYHDRIMAGEQIVSEAKILRKDGAKVDTEFNNRCVEILGTSYMHTVARDITQRKEAEEKARRHQSELAHIARLGTIGQMASELAHELNQPLCATLTHLEGCLKIVKSGSLNTDKVLKKLETATRQVDQAGAIISRVKGFAMKGKIKRSTVFINDIVREAVNFSEMEMRNNHITTEFDLGRKIQPVLANSIQIEQVILNLIQNAIEAMKDIPKNRRKLTISTTMLDDTVEVAVRDAGKGIDKDNAENIFESFVTTKSDGLGIGLSISQSILESHGGRIYFKDNCDHGVTFIFTLPLPLKVEKYS